MEQAGRKPERYIDIVQRIIDAVLSDAEVVFDMNEFPPDGPYGAPQAE